MSRNSTPQWRSPGSVESQRSKGTHRRQDLRATPLQFDMSSAFGRTSPWQRLLASLASAPVAVPQVPQVPATMLMSSEGFLVSCNIKVKTMMD
nr:hypothetical protein Iba_chr03cCG4320 [Ipomoea batatas]